MTSSTRSALTCSGMPPAARRRTPGRWRNGYGPEVIVNRPDDDENGLRENSSPPASGPAGVHVENAGAVQIGDRNTQINIGPVTVTTGRPTRTEMVRVLLRKARTDRQDPRVPRRTHAALPRAGLLVVAFAASACLLAGDASQGSRAAQIRDGRAQAALSGDGSRCGTYRSSIPGTGLPANWSARPVRTVASPYAHFAVAFSPHGTALLDHPQVQGPLRAQQLQVPQADHDAPSPATATLTRSRHRITRRPPAPASGSSTDTPADNRSWQAATRPPGASRARVSAR